jgi:predicted MFS family arabinose efflux permease
VTPNEATTMTPQERRATIWLASIYALRMFGLFSILPVFAIYARALKGGDVQYMVALALSIYGLTQALLYIGYGAASDRFGRKPVIVVGLLIFAAGSVVAALSSSVAGIALGRVLQGAGAVSSAITAFVADSTRDSVRTKAMAMVGGSIGITFALALVIAPPLVGVIGLSGIFWLTAALAMAAIYVVIFLVPNAPVAETPAETIRHGDVLFHPQLFRLNFGVFVLHATLVALFVIVPPLLVERAGIAAANHWWVYLPVIILSFGLMIRPMLMAERQGKVSEVFRFAIALLFATFAFGPFATQLGLWGLFAFLLAFFFAFNLLEAMQPSLVSRVAPPQMKGFAMGVYNTTQAMGLFLGGILGGVVTKRFGESFVFVVCAVLAVLWLMVAWRVKAPSRPQ